MSIVRFDNIGRLAPGQVVSLNPQYNFAAPFSPIVDPGDRPGLYDPDWGYYLFGQRVGFEYGDSRAYRTVAQFTIQGVFTITAEQAAAEATGTDDQRFATMVARYEALVNMFKAKAAATPPASIANWGTVADPRCVVLPEPLRDKDGHQIFALPGTISVEPGTWGREIKYAATLTECKPPQAKLRVNGHTLDHGVVSVSFPRPMLARTRLRGCAGEVLECQNYAVAEVTATGSLTRGASQNMPIIPGAAALLQSLEAGVATVQVERFESGAATVVDLYPNLDVDRGVGVEVDVEGLTNTVTVVAKRKGA
jgi:hypothetical protein